MIHKYGWKKPCDDIGATMIVVSHIKVFQPRLSTQDISNAVIFIDSTNQVVRRYGAADIRSRQ